MPAIVMEKTDSQIDVCGKNHSKHFNRILIPYWKCLWAFVAASSRSGCVLSQKNTNKETNKVFWVHKVKKNDDAPAAQFFICFMRAWHPPKPNNFLDVLSLIQCSSRVTVSYISYTALVSTLSWLVRRTEQRIHGYSSLSLPFLVNLSYYRSGREPEALQYLSRGERGIEMVPLEFDCHTR